MSSEEEALLRRHHRRIRWTKRLLRPLPRRATIHRYPGLGWFAGFARRRAALWSFRVPQVTRALWIGSLLAFTPLYGTHVILGCLLAVLLEANLPIVIGLPMLTNPLTVAPVYFTAFEIGRLFLKMFGAHTLRLNTHELKMMLENFWHGHWGRNAHLLAEAFGVTMLGGLIMGTFVAVLASAAYQMAARRAERRFARVQQIRRERDLHVPRPKPSPAQHAPARRPFRKGRRWR